MFHLRTNLRSLIYLKTLRIQFSTTKASPKNMKSRNPLIADHLITTFGFSSEKAISASMLFPRFSSPADLTSVPEFLKQSGFSDTQIRNLISRRPITLLSKIDKTLKPKLKLLEEIGLSGSSLAELIVKNPVILSRNVDNHIVPTINCLRSLLHSNENIVKALKRYTWLLSSTFRKTIGGHIDNLRQCGVTDEGISNLLLKQPRFFTRKPCSLKGLVTQMEEYGFRKDSALFIYTIMEVSTIGKDRIKEKFEVYKSYGWSESDILSAFRKSPIFLTLSEKKVRKSMSFLIDELGYEPKDTALMPTILTYSLEKRLKPRSEVLKILNSKGLLEKKPHLLSIVVMTEKKFCERYIVKFADSAPDIKRAYMSSGFDAKTMRMKECKLN